MRKTIVAIDFDGVVVHHQYPNIGALLPGAKNCINKLYEDFYIIIWTCRGGENLGDIIRFMDAKGIKYHKVNENAPFEIIGFKPSPKVYADFYIDDNNLGGFPGWEIAYKMIVNTL